VPDLGEGIPEGLDPEQPVWVLCEGGFRATIAAGLLERAGSPPSS
jgi:rhodanese-related sulfurtransferase